MCTLNPISEYKVFTIWLIVCFFLHLSGQIKNIIYQSEDDNNLITGSSSINHHRQEPIKWNGLRRDTSEPCSDSDPCNHGGTCINTDSGAECDCRGLDYIGDHCDKRELLSI